MRALVIGHFSTIGDMESLFWVERILKAKGLAYDIAPFKPKLAASISGAVPAAQANPGDYTHLIAVCGPFWPDFLARHNFDLDRFAHCTRIGVNLTMVIPLDQWNPFHVLIERDSSDGYRPDATFLVDTPLVVVAGLCTIASQREYGERQRHETSAMLFSELIDLEGLAVINIDTKWPRSRNAGMLGSPAEVLSVIRKTDVMLTNRLHGLVYSLKAGIPVLALDPVLGGDKVSAQARTIGWPATSTVESASIEWMREQLAWCLSNDGRAAAKAVSAKARQLLEPLAGQLGSALGQEYSPLPVPRPLRQFRQGIANRIANAIRSKLR